MKKNIIVYYSRKGSNKFLAEQAAATLQCEIVPLKPRLNLLFFLLLSSATKISLGNRSIKTDFKDFESIILCGPIWMGQFVSPLYDFVKKYKNDIQHLDFITCCGSTDTAKNERFGYATVFPKIREILGDKCGKCEAFPIELIVPEEKRNDDQAMMNARLSASNFTGEIKKRFDNFFEA
ncbi:MAG: hypothetical protein JEY91_03860 [Spirochaetaceae bacterium]|nr:hypothetical protein [Spirochaetaceae bacterium]